MKDFRINFKLLSLIATTFFVMFSCNRDDVNTNLQYEGSNRALLGYSVTSANKLFPGSSTEEIIEFSLDASDLSSTGREVNVTFNSEESRNITPELFTVLNAYVDANSYQGKVKVKINNSLVTPGTIYKLVLDINQSNNEEFTVNTSKNSLAITFNKCFNEGFPLDVTTIPTAYDVKVRAFNQDAPSHNQTLTYLGGNSQAVVFSTPSSWGPNFVGWATNDPSYNGQFLYPGNITINNQTGVVSFVGTRGTGTGTYDPCTGIIKMTINQNLFTTQFEVECTFIPGT